MGRGLTLVLGGARSGKTAFAQRLADEDGGAVLYVATGEAGDEEMTARIAAHRAERPAGWRTLEAPLRAGKAIREAGGEPSVVLLDCLSLLAANAIARLKQVLPETAVLLVDAELDGLLEAYRSSAARWIVVSSEVGLGIVPDTPLGRAYRDALGLAHQRLAREADEVLLIVAGLPLRLK